MIKIIVTVIHGALYGAIVGLLWWLAMGTITAMYISACAGAGLGLLLGLMSVAASLNGMTDREGIFVSGALMTLAAMASGIVALLVWAYRALTG
jgi:small basic protein